jgi:hypothetical protein
VHSCGLSVALPLYALRQAQCEDDRVWPRHLGRCCIPCFLTLSLSKGSRRSAASGRLATCFMVSFAWHLSRPPAWTTSVATSTPGCGRTPRAGRRHERHGAMDGVIVSNRMCLLPETMNPRWRTGCTRSRQERGTSLPPPGPACALVKRQAGRRLGGVIRRAPRLRAAPLPAALPGVAARRRACCAR